MKSLVGAALAASLTASTAIAGGVERSAFSSSILFEEGTYTQLSFGVVSPSVSGTIAGGTLSSGDIFSTYAQWALGFKTDINDKLALAVIIDQPIGADTSYPAGTGYPLAGSTATIGNLGVTALAKYKLPSNISVYGGVRALQSRGDVALSSGYTLATTDELDFGYIVGAAWEKPEIAARVALTYISAITHDFGATENGGPSLDFSTTIPQSITLEAQSGIAEDTLMFGSVRWVDWSVFDVTPAGFAAATGGDSLVDFENSTTTYTLGVGRRFNEQWSGALIGSYEPSSGTQSGNLGPTDGQTAVSVAATYSPNERVEITGGLTYAFLGNTFTEVPVGGGATTPSDFSGNNAIAAGIRIGLKM